MLECNNSYKVILNLDYMPDFIYRIQPIVPPSEPRTFSIDAELDYNFAFKARDTEMPEDIKNRFNEMGNSIVKRFFGSRKLLPVQPYNFVEKSWLLHYCSVPGNACEFGLCEHAQSDLAWYFEKTKQSKIPIPEGLTASYSPHNVDTKDQAFCLQSLWLHWVNNVQALLEEKP